MTGVQSLAEAKDFSSSLCFQTSFDTYSSSSRLGGVEVSVLATGLKANPDEVMDF
jgi:hypothetical protein